MKVIPAIDLIAGRCVRLTQGDFDRETVYSDDPATALVGFADSGADVVHLVDLDGARAGEPRQHDLFADLAADITIALQVAGGFRTEEQVARMLRAGVQRVVIGSLALSAPEVFASMLGRFGADRLTLALDVRMEEGIARVATHGWSRSSEATLAEVLGRFPEIRHLLVTDIARDGMLGGPNVELMRTIRHDFPQVELQASGGVATLQDLDALQAAGASAAIVGKAIWEGRFTVREGLARARG